MNAPYENSESTPVWSRQVFNDVLVTKWCFYGWFKAPLQLSEYLEEVVEIAPVWPREGIAIWQGTKDYKNFQFAFVFDWKPEQINKDLMTL